MTTFWYHFTNYLLLSAILVLLYVFDGPEIIAVTTSAWAAGTAFSGILLLFLFYFYYNFGSEYIIRWGTKYFSLNNWAGYVDRINRQDLTRLITIITNRVYT